MHLVKMILIDMVIAKSVNELTNVELTHMGHQVHKQRIGADVEWHPEKCIRRSLVKLAMKCASAFNLELEQRVTRRQIDIARLLWIPPCDNQTSRVRIGLNLMYKIRYLVRAVSFRIVSAKRTPEIDIKRAEVTYFTPKPPSVFFVSPFGPDVHPFRAKLGFVRVT